MSAASHLLSDKIPFEEIMTYVHTRDRELKEAEQSRLQNLRKDWVEQHEKAQEALKNRQMRKFEKIKTRISYPEPYPDFYVSAPIKPGLLFWKSLLLNPDYPPVHLKVHLPDSLFIFDKLYWAYTEPHTGKIRCTDEFSIISFYRSFEPAKTDLSLCAVMRIPEEKITENKAVLLSWPEFEEKVIKNQLPGTGVIQKFIRGRSESRPTVTRLFYIQQTKQNKATYGYTIANTDAVLDTYTGKHLVCMENYDGMEITPLYSQALKEVTEMGSRVVDYLQVAHSIRIEEIVLDFLRDRTGVQWLLGCKGFKLDMVAQRTRELREEAEEGKSAMEIKAERAELLDAQLSAMHCKLCLLPYKPFEMKKSLPFKVLLIYKQHSARSERKLLDLSHLRVNTPDFLSHSVRICDICYMLVIQEYELLQTEMKLADLLHVPMKVPQVMGTPQYEHPNFMPTTMQQWRFLFYFKSLESTGDLPPHFNLQYHFLGTSQSYPVNPQWKDGTTRLNTSHLHYVFAPPGPAIGNFCQETEVSFSLTTLSGGLRGDCKPLSLFSNSLSTGLASVQPFDILLFDTESAQMKLRLCVGIVCDKLIKAKELPVTIHRVGGLFLPEPSFFSSDCLPEAWLEAFEHEYTGVEESRILDSSEELDEMYTPALGKYKMLASPFGSTKVLHMKVDLNPLNERKPESPHHFRRLSEPSFVSGIRNVPSLPALEGIKPKLKGTDLTSHRTIKTPGSRSTASSSKVLYQVDNTNKLKSPTFMSARPSTQMSARSTNPDHIPLQDDSGSDASLRNLQDFICKQFEENCGNEEVADIVKKYITRRSTHTPNSPRLLEKGLGKRSKSQTGKKAKRRKLRLPTASNGTKKTR